MTESLRFNDIVLFDFIDSYRNMTLKHLSGFSWLDQQCGPKRDLFVLKADDDVFVETFDLIRNLKYHGFTPKREIYLWICSRKSKSG